MPSFRYLSDYDINENSTSTFTFDFVPGKPQIVCAPAINENAKFLNERMRLLAQRPKGDPGESKETRVAFRKHFARIVAGSCAVGWGDRPPIDDDRKPVEFTRENAEAFLTELAGLFPFQFNLFTNWIADPEKFARVPLEVMDELGKA